MSRRCRSFEWRYWCEVEIPIQNILSGAQIRSA
jgi:hypothetical protein